MAPIDEKALPPRQYSTKLRFILAELFRQATFYLAELCRQATFYLAELYRHIAFLYFFIYLLCNLIIITVMWLVTVFHVKKRDRRQKLLKFH